MNLSLALLLYLSSPADTAYAAKVAAPSAAQSGSADLNVIDQFIALAEKGAKNEAADLIRFPILRTKPLPALRNKAEFVAAFAEFIDASTIAKLKASRKEVSESWRGTSIGPGDLYASGGKIYAINVRTQKQATAAAVALVKEQKGFHSSVDKYAEIAFACDTPGRRVRVQRLVGGKLRLVTWPPGEGLHTVPNLTMENGEELAQGSGGNTVYRFKDGKSVYDVNETQVCGANCDSYLEIREGKKAAVKEACGKDA